MYNSIAKVLNRTGGDEFTCELRGILALAFSRYFSHPVLNSRRDLTRCIVRLARFERIPLKTTHASSREMN